MVGAKRKKKVAKPINSLHGLAMWRRVGIIVEKHCANAEEFCRLTGLTTAVISRIKRGIIVPDHKDDAVVSPRVRQIIQKRFGYSDGIWVPLKPSRAGMNEDAHAEHFKALLDEELASSEQRRRTPRVLGPLAIRAPREGEFAGRTGELREIQKAGNHGVVLIKGDSGAGKSELVLKWWHQHGAGDFDGAVFAEECRKLPSVEDFILSLSEWRRQVLKQPADGRAAASGRGASKARQSTRRALIFLDDIDALLEVSEGAATELRDGYPTYVKDLLEPLLRSDVRVLLIAAAQRTFPPWLEAFAKPTIIDLNKGLGKRDGARLLAALGSTASKQVREEVSEKLRGHPQKLRLFAAVVKNKKPEAVPAAYHDMLSGNEQAVEVFLKRLSYEAIVQELPVSQLNLLRAIAAHEEGLRANDLELLAAHEEVGKRSKRIFVKDEWTSNYKTLPLVQQIESSEPSAPLVKMHYLARQGVLQEWRRTRPDSLERFKLWQAEREWESVFPHAQEGQAFRHSEDVPSREHLHALVRVAIYLLESTMVQQNASAAADRPVQEVTHDVVLGTTKSLTLERTKQVFKSNSSHATRIRFAYLEIIARRVERPRRPGLTNYYGRNDALIRFFLPLMPTFFEWEQTEDAGFGNLRAEIEAADPLKSLAEEHKQQAIILLGRCCLQLGWLKTAERAFNLAAEYAVSDVSAGPASVQAARSNKALARLLDAASRLQRGHIDTARKKLQLAEADIVHINTNQRRHSLNRRLLSLRSRAALLRGDLDTAAAFDASLHKMDSTHWDLDLLARLQEVSPKDRLSASFHYALVPKGFDLSERGRYSIQLRSTDPDHEASLLSYWYLCYRATLARKQPAEQCRLLILGASLFRAQGDGDNAEYCLELADVVGEEFDVHLPIRLEWRLERAKCTLTFNARDKFKRNADIIENLIGVADDYSLRLAQCDGHLMSAWFAMVGNDRRKKATALAAAQKLIDRLGFGFRSAEIAALTRNQAPSAFVSLV